MKVKLIVPNCNRNASPIVAYGKAIADIAGGFTASQATGGWVDDNQNLIVEPVTVFDIYDDVPSDGWNRVAIPAIDCRDDWRILAKRIAQELNQDCVYLEIDGNVELVKP